MADLTLLTICGSLRKGSYNAMVRRGLPSLAPEGMTIKAAPSVAKFPLYNADVQDANGFPAAVNTLADAIRAADGVIFDGQQSISVRHGGGECHEPSVVNSMQTLP
jgi:chromate reductase, NAD(P)H dehydrogenase (quinone)